MNLNMEPSAFIKDFLAEYVSKTKALILGIGLLLQWLLASVSSHLPEVFFKAENIGAMHIAILWLTIVLILLVAHILEKRLNLRYFLNVLWDKRGNIFCSDCKVLLAPVNINEQWSHHINRSSFQCPKCKQTYLLKGKDDRPIAKSQAEEMFRESLHAK